MPIYLGDTEIGSGKLYLGDTEINNVQSGDNEVYVSILNISGQSLQGVTSNAQTSWSVTYSGDPGAQFTVTSASNVSGDDFSSSTVHTIGSDGTVTLTGTITAPNALCSNVSRTISVTITAEEGTSINGESTLTGNRSYSGSKAVPDAPNISDSLFTNWPPSGTIYSGQSFTLTASSSFPTGVSSILLRWGSNVTSYISGHGSTFTTGQSRTITITSNAPAFSATPFINATASVGGCEQASSGFLSSKSFSGPQPTYTVESSCSNCSSFGGDFTGVEGATVNLHYNYTTSDTTRQCGGNACTKNTSLSTGTSLVCLVTVPGNNNGTCSGP